MALKRDTHKLVITIDNIGPADAIGLIKMFEYMQYLGNIGSSRWCSFFADGDGSFHPKVSFEYPEELPKVPEIDGIITRKDINDNEQVFVSSEGDFVIDSDSVAWKIYHNGEE